MIGLLQRVTSASVVVENETIGHIEQGILVLLGVQRDDDVVRADRLLERILTYRLFRDDEGKMNRNLIDIQGGLLIVPQFTLAAETKKGTRPGFSTAATPALANKLFEYTIEVSRKRFPSTQSGRFGADMKVSLTNDGPVTFWLET